MKGTQYFSHDYNARNDPKLRKLRKKYGCTGIGAYWLIVEIMYEQGGSLPYDASDLAFELQEEDVMVTEIISAFDLFENDGANFWSPSIRRRLELREMKTEQTRAAGIASAQKRAEARQNSTSVERPLNDRSTIKVKGKGKVKGKNSESPGEGAAPSGAPPPASAKNSEREIREAAFYETLVPYVAEYGKRLVREFYNHWREPTKSGTKMRWETERTWSIELRLQKWRDNDDKWNKSPKTNHDESATDSTAERMEKILGSGS